MLDARVLGQLLLIQSVLNNLPDETSIFNFVSRGLADLPGVAGVSFTGPEQPGGPPGNLSLPLPIGESVKGYLHLRLSDREAFAPYEDYLGNFCFMLAVILEERAHRREIDAYKTGLEDLVRERTRMLSEEIAQKEEARLALRRSQERLSLALQAVSDGLWDWRLDSGEVYFSPRWYAMLGYESGDLPASYQTWRSLVHPEDIALAERHVSAHVESGEALDIEFRMRRKDGGWIWVHSRGRVVETAPDGRPLRMVGTHTDVTERRQMLDAMIQTEKMMSVGGLAAGMAHEINNPLSGILQAVQVLTSRLTKDTPASLGTAKDAGCEMGIIRDFLERRDIFKMIDAIKDSAVRAARIVSTMLEFSRKSESALTPASLNELVDKAIELCSSDYDLKKKYDFRRIDITREYDTSLPPVPCSAGQIQQVLLNILGNAAHAMAGMDAPRITLRTRANGSMAYVEVEDNGPGMDEETRRKAFEPFFTTKAVGQGTGLGLSVSYFIVVNNHGGTLEVDSTPGEGTRFIIGLPLGRGAIGQAEAGTGGAAAAVAERQ
ncbi:MAG: two-component system sensor histidine kinase NtrB [Thermodesulfobacteriota bacterium]